LDEIRPPEQSIKPTSQIDNYNVRISKVRVWQVATLILGIALVFSVFSDGVNIEFGRDAEPTGDVVVQPPRQAAPPSAPAPTPIVAVSEDDDPVLGDKNAPVTIIEFSDFQCSFCKRLREQTIEPLKKEYIETGKVKLVYRDYPLGFHQYAHISAEAAECADDQGKFWEYHDKLFENQQFLDEASLKKYAEELKLDTKEFNECLDSGKHKAEVDKDISDGTAAGVTGTPASFINGRKMVGAQPYEAFRQAIEAELAKL